MKLGGRRREDLIEPNLTPMIDVVFLLLLFFILSTTFEKETHLKIELPETNSENSQPKDEKEKVVEALIAPDGRIYLDNKEVRNLEHATLVQALKKVAPDPQTAIIISGDKKAQYETVIKLMGAAADAELTKLKFAVDVTPEE